MPELPDVEGFRRGLAATLPGRRIRRVRVHDPGVLRNTTPQALGRRVDGHRFDDPRRHGKWLILPGGVLRTVVRHGRVPGLPRWLTGARDDPDPHCPRCGTALTRGKVGGRTSLWCPRCQP